MSLIQKWCLDALSTVRSKSFCAARELRGVVRDEDCIRHLDDTELANVRRALACLDDLSLRCQAELQRRDAEPTRVVGAAVGRDQRTYLGAESSYGTQVPLKTDSFGARIVSAFPDVDWSDRKKHADTGKLIADQVEKARKLAAESRAKRTDRSHERDTPYAVVVYL